MLLSLCIYFQTQKQDKAKYQLEREKLKKNNKQTTVETFCKIRKTLGTPINLKYYSINSNSSFFDSTEIKYSDLSEFLFCFHFRGITELKLAKCFQSLVFHIRLHRIPKDNDCILKSKNVHSSVPSSTIHHSQDTEMTCKSITRGMDKEDVV